MNAPHLAADVHAHGTAILSNEHFPRGARAAHFMRTVGGSLKFSVEARYLYVQIASCMTKTNTATVARTAIVNWLGGVSPRTASRIVAELTRTGPVPLLVQKPGRPGRASVFAFVHNPWALAETQAAQAAETRAKRQGRVLAKQQQIQRDAEAASSTGDPVTTEATIAKMHRARRMADWALPKRTPPVPVPDRRFLRGRLASTG